MGRGGQVKILVTGSRWYDTPEHRARLEQILDDLSPTEVVHGAAPGADYMADFWCKKNGVEFTRVPASWRLHGKAAGPLRNIQMLDEHPDIELVVAFPLEGSIGTWHMVKTAEARDIPVMVVDNPHES
jgi:hypothetical protein